MPIATVNPATGELIEEFAAHTKEQVGQRLTRAEAAAATLRATDFDTRARWMRAAADLVEADTARTARMLTIEMGKPIAQARAEVLKCARAMRFYADNAESLLADQPLADPSTVQASAAYNPGGQTRSAIQGDCVPGWRSSGGLRSGDGLGHPAVDTQDLTGHVGGVVGRQEGGHGTDLGGVGPAVRRIPSPWDMPARTSSGLLPCCLPMASVLVSQPSVFVIPGEIALTRMLLGAASVAR